MNASNPRILTAALVMVALSAPAVLAQDSTIIKSGSSLTREYNPETGKAYSSKSTVGPNGATREVVQKCAGGQGDGTGKCRTSRTITTASGEVATRNTNRIMGQNTFRARQTTTGFGGQSTTKKRWFKRK